MSQTPIDGPSAATVSGLPAGPAGAADNSSKRRRALKVLALLAILAGIGAMIYWLHVYNYESTDDAFIEGHVAFISPKVSGQVLTLNVSDNELVKEGQLLVTIDPRDYQARLDQASGALKAAQAQAQAAKTNLELTKVTAPADMRLSQAGVDAANSAVNSAQSQVVMARSQQDQANSAVQSAQASLEQARAEAVAAQAEANRAKDDLARYSELVKTESATAQQLDNASAAAKMADAKYDSALKAVAVAQAHVVSAQAAAKTAAEAITQAQALAQQAVSAAGQAVAKLTQAEPFAQRIAYATSQLDTADAQVAQLQAAVASAQLQLEYCTIHAPRDGYVTRRSVEQGTYLQPGQPMLTIVDPKVWVVANFKETQLEHMKPGQPVSVSVDSMAGRKIKAHVDSIMAGSGARFSLLPSENATGNYVKVVQRVPVKIVFDEPINQYKLGPGMSVEPSVKVR